MDRSQGPPDCRPPRYLRPSAHTPPNDRQVLRGQTKPVHHPKKKHENSLLKERPTHDTRFGDDGSKEPGALAHRHRDQQPRGGTRGRGDTAAPVCVARAEREGGACGGTSGHTAEPRMAPPATVHFGGGGGGVSTEPRKMGGGGGRSGKKAPSTRAMISIGAEGAKRQTVAMVASTNAGGRMHVPLE